MPTRCTRHLHDRKNVPDTPDTFFPVLRYFDFTGVEITALDLDARTLEFRLTASLSEQYLRGKLFMPRLIGTTVRIYPLSAVFGARAGIRRRPNADMLTPNLYAEFMAPGL